MFMFFPLNFERFHSKSVIDNSFNEIDLPSQRYKNPIQHSHFVEFLVLLCVGEHGFWETADEKCE